MVHLVIHKTIIGVVTKVTECQAKCDQQVNGCIYTCAQT